MPFAQVAVETVCRQEGLKEDAFISMIEGNHFSGKPPLNDAVVAALASKPKILARKSVAERIVKKLLGLISTFGDGVHGQ